MTPQTHLRHRVKSPMSEDSRGDQVRKLVTEKTRIETASKGSISLTVQTPLSRRSTFFSDKGS